VAGEVGEFVVGTDVVGGSGGTALPGTFNVTAAVSPGIGAVVIGDPNLKAVGD
jgi:hypothetical protein